MTITEQEVADAVREWVELNNPGDDVERVPENVARLVAMEAESAGFGYRTSAWRDVSTVGRNAYAQVMTQYWSQIVYFRTELADLHTSVLGDVGFAWGGYTEEFQEKGRTPERAKVRFSMALTKEPEGWKVLSFHRDIQPFDADGRYLRSLAEIQPAG